MEVYISKLNRRIVWENCYKGNNFFFYYIEDVGVIIYNGIRKIVPLGGISV